MLRRIKALKTAVLRLRVQEAHVKGDAAKLDTALVRGLLDGFFLMKRGVHGVLDMDDFVFHRPSWRGKTHGD